MNEQRDTARAIDALRRGWPVAIDGVITVLPIESADQPRLLAFDPENRSHVLISSGRAVTLKLANQLAAATAGAPGVGGRASWVGPSGAAGPGGPAAHPPQPLVGPIRGGPFAEAGGAPPRPPPRRRRGLLPAFFVQDGAQASAQPVTSGAIRAWDAPERLAIAARARLPVAAAEGAELVAFRSPESANEHVALIIGQPNGAPPLVRLHSECLTGDVLGSLK